MGCFIYLFINNIISFNNLSPSPSFSFVRFPKWEQIIQATPIAPNSNIAGPSATTDCRSEQINGQTERRHRPEALFGI